MTKIYELPNGRKVKVTAKNKRVAKKFHGQDHYAYTFIIEVDDKMYKSTFHDSVYNYRRGIGATKQMIDEALDCTLMDYDSFDYNNELDDFLRAYGYEDREMGRKVYNGCRETYECLNEMFSREELNDLEEILYPNE